MRRTLRSLTVGIVGLLGACAYATQETQQYDPDQPLFARLSPTTVEGTHRLRVDLNKPAYFAVFEIVPQHGASLLYPMASQLGEGPKMEYTEFLPTFIPGRDYYELTDVQLAAEQPVFRLLVASRDSLRIRYFAEHPGGLREVLGATQFANADPYRMMDRLMELVLPEEPDDAWSTDIDVIWPAQYRPRLASDYELSECLNGHLFFAPFDYPYDGCPGDHRYWGYWSNGFNPFYAGIPVGYPIGQTPTGRPPVATPPGQKPPVDTSGGKPKDPDNPVRRRPADPGTGGVPGRSLLPPDYFGTPRRDAAKRMAAGDDADSPKRRDGSSTIAVPAPAGTGGNQLAAPAPTPIHVVPRSSDGRPVDVGTIERRHAERSFDQSTRGSMIERSPSAIPRNDWSRGGEGNMHANQPATHFESPRASGGSSGSAVPTVAPHVMPSPPPAAPPPSTSGGGSGSVGKPDGGSGKPNP